MTRAAQAEDRVANALTETFRAAGYAGASLRTLGQAAGLKSASLYYRFPDGKPGMAETALSHLAERFAAEVIAPLTGFAPVGERLAGSAAGLRRFYAGGGLACLLAIFSLSDAPPPVLAGVRNGFAAWIEALAAVLEETGRTSARSEAEDLVAGVQGALILARADQGRAAFARAVDRIAGAAG